MKRMISMMGAIEFGRRFGWMIVLAAGLLTAAIANAGEWKGVVRTADGGSPGAGWRVVGRSLDGNGVAIARTDADGRFELSGLSAGRAAVVILPPGAPREEGAPLVSDASDDPRGGAVVALSSDHPSEIVLTLQPNATAAPTFQFLFYEGEYWNNKPSELGADPVNVLTGQAATNIDFTLDAGGGTISGQVVRDSNGTPITGLIVTAFSVGGPLSFDRTDGTGHYRITGISAGSYYVAAGLLFPDPNGSWVAEFYDNAPTFTSAATVTVNEGADTPNINISLASAGSISGEVVSDQGGAGLEATVTATAVSNGATVFTTTAGNGSYTLRGLAAGNWKVSASSDNNYVDEYWNNKTTLDMADPVTVTAGANTPNINISLATGASIDGTVTMTGSGTPLENYIVFAERIGDNLTRVALTAANGAYQITRLPAGDYRVSVPLLGVYWNGKSTAETADPVTVAASGSVHNIDMSGTPLSDFCGLSPQEAGSIHGTVTGDNFGPIPDAEIYVFIDVLGSKIMVDEANSGPDGTYTVDCLTEGTYYLKCEAPFTPFVNEWYDDKDGEEQANEVAVTAGQTHNGVNFLLGRGASISGHVMTTGGAPIGGIEVYVKNSATQETTSDFTDGAGNYTVASGDAGGLPGGSYVVYTEGISTADPSLVAVVLSKFTATPGPDGTILEWTTASERDHAGFMVERSVTTEGVRSRLSDRLITGGPDYRFVDSATPAGDAWYWLVAVSRTGHEERFGPISTSGAPIAATRLLGPAVNPSAGNAVIRWTLGQPSRVSLRLFDPAGRLVRTLVDGVRPAGDGSATWDGRGDDGSAAAAGLYFIRFETPDGVEKGRLVLAK